MKTQKTFSISGYVLPISIGLLLFFQACGVSFEPARFISSTSVTGPDDDDGEQGASVSPRAPDPTQRGPNSTAISEYRLPAQVDGNILAGRETEIWAEVHRPTNLVGQRLPLIVFLHGNHSTCGIPPTTPGAPRIDNDCQYTQTGTCPAGSVVVPNHQGYRYLSEILSSWGYLVVSINANRGITCGGGVAGDNGLNLARGGLVLKHLQLLSQWNTSGGAPPSLGFNIQGSIDFNNVGLMGHSRGGEGVRAAVNLYSDAGSPWPSLIGSPVGFKGVFEIAPVDGQTSRVLNASTVPWSVLLPLCDGDVSNLAGIQPYDRMMSEARQNPLQLHPPRVALGIWGANHNFYNTEWQQSDSGGCRDYAPLWNPSDIGSEAQRSTGLITITSFFRANVGLQAQESFNRNLDPSFLFTETFQEITKVGREFSRQINSIDVEYLEDFTRPAPQGKSGINHVTTGVTVTHINQNPHASARRMGRLVWTASGSRIDFLFTNQQTPKNLSSFKTLDLSLARIASAQNSATVPTDFSIQLIDSSGGGSVPVLLSDYLTLLGPSGLQGLPHSLSEAVRLPLKDLVGVNLQQIVGLRLIFNQTPTGDIVVSDIRASKLITPTFREAPSLPITLSSLENREPAFTEPTISGEISAVNPVSGTTATYMGIRNSSPTIEVTVELSEPLPVRDSLYELQIGEFKSQLSRFSDDGKTDKIIFVFDQSQVDQMKSQDQAKLKTSGSANWEVNLGLFGNNK